MLYRQATAKRIAKDHKTSLKTNAKGNSLGGGKKEVTTRNKKITNGKVTHKGKHKIIVGNHPHKNMLLKQATVRRAQTQEMEIAFEIKRPAT